MQQRLVGGIHLGLNQIKNHFQGYVLSESLNLIRMPVDYYPLVKLNIFSFLLVCSHNITTYISFVQYGRLNSEARDRLLRQQ